MEKLLTQTEVKEILKISDSTLERWRREGTGPRFVHCGRTIRYMQEHLDEYINGSISAGRV